MTSAAYIHVNQMYTLMKIKHVTNEVFPQILSPRHRMPATGSLISHVDFASKKGKEKKKMKNAFVVLEERKEERKKETTDEKKNPINLSNNRHIKKQNIKFWYSAAFLNRYRSILRIITKCLRLRKSHKGTQVPFIPLKFFYSE